MKIYPRHNIDLNLSSLFNGLLSYFIPLNRNKIEKEIISFWEKRENVKISFSVRTSFDSFLTAMNLPKDSEILMSAINIKHMVEIADNHNLKIIPMDIKLNDLSVSLKNFDKIISNKTKILVFAQLFGSIVDLKELSVLCKKNDIILIEDCAQAFKGKEYQGSVHADLSLFSFGTIKSSAALGGAIVLSNSSKYLDLIDSVEKNYLNRGEFWFFKRIIKYIFIKFTSQPIVYGLFIKFLILFNIDVEQTINGFTRSFSKGKLTDQIRYIPPTHMLNILNIRLKNNKNSDYIKRENDARLLLKKLENLVVVPSISTENHSFWVIPILVNDTDSLQKLLLKNGFDSTKANHSQTAIKSKLYSIPNATKLMNNIVYLPNIKNINTKERDRLVDLLKTFLKE